MPAPTQGTAAVVWPPPQPPRGQKAEEDKPRSMIYRFFQQVFSFLPSLFGPLISNALPPRIQRVIGLPLEPAARESYSIIIKIIVKQEQKLVKLPCCCWPVTWDEAAACAGEEGSVGTRQLPG